MPRIPFSINVAKLSQDQVSELLDDFEHVLGGQYFRDKSLFLEVLADQIEATKKPLTYLYGPYLKVIAKQDGTLRITSGDKPEGGETVYAHDQICDLLTELKVGQEAPKRPSQKP